MKLFVLSQNVAVERKSTTSSMQNFARCYAHKTGTFVLNSSNFPMRYLTVPDIRIQTIQDNNTIHFLGHIQSIGRRDGAQQGASYKINTEGHKHGKDVGSYGSLLGLSHPHSPFLFLLKF